MKLTKSVITTIFIALIGFTSILYTSCKNSCAHLTCFNGGSCSNGFCTCPYGYTGNSCEIPNTTSIQYYNHTYTDVILTLNNTEYTIPPHQIKGFSGQYGDSLKGNAYTSGEYGERITWDTVNNTFPINGTLTVNFDVNPNYFFLEVANDSASSVIREITVNSGLSTEIDIILPAPYMIYGSSMNLGYFYDSVGNTAASNVLLKSTSQRIFAFPSGSATSLSLSMTQDQAILVTAP